MASMMSWLRLISAPRGMTVLMAIHRILSTILLPFFCMRFITTLSLRAVLPLLPRLSASIWSSMPSFITTIAHALIPFWPILIIVQSLAILQKVMTSSRMRDCSRMPCVIVPCFGPMPIIAWQSCMPPDYLWPAPRYIIMIPMLQTFPISSCIRPSGLVPKVSCIPSVRISSGCKTHVSTRISRARIPAPRRIPAWVIFPRGIEIAILMTSRIFYRREAFWRLVVCLYGPLCLSFSSLLSLDSCYLVFASHCYSGCASATDAHLHHQTRKGTPHLLSLPRKTAPPRPVPLRREPFRP